MKYTLDYAMRMPSREKITKPWNNFHGICIGYYMLLSVIIRLFRIQYKTPIAEACD